MLLRLVFPIVVVLGGGMVGCRVEFATEPLSTTLSLATKVNPAQLIKNHRIDRNKFVQLMTTGAFSDSNGLDMQKMKAALDQVVSFPLQGRIERTFMWEVTAPDGNKHWLFAEMHVEYPLAQLPATSQLLTAIKQATVFMPEVTLATSLDFYQADRNDPHAQAIIAMRQKFISEQITNQAEQRAAKIIELDDMSTLLKYHQEWQKASQNITAVINEDDQLAFYLDKVDLLLQQNYAYMEGDLITLTEVIQQLDPYHHIKIDRRNIAWVEKIIAQCQQGESCLIYPGIGHVLDNDTSLIALLRKEGYTVQRAD